MKMMTVSFCGLGQTVELRSDEALAAMREASREIGSYVGGAHR